MITIAQLSAAQLTCFSAWSRVLHSTGSRVCKRVLTCHGNLIREILCACCCRSDTCDATHARRELQGFPVRSDLTRFLLWQG